MTDQVESAVLRWLNDVDNLRALQMDLSDLMGHDADAVREAARLAREASPEALTACLYPDTSHVIAIATAISVIMWLKHERGKRKDGSE